MLDLVIRNGQVITPQGVGLWDVGIKGERIAVIGAPGTLPTEGARVIDAAGQIVVAGRRRAARAPGPRDHVAPRGSPR